MSGPLIGCGDNSCTFSVIKPRGGMGTNGGCRCFRDLESWIEGAGRWNREEVRHVERSTRILAMEVVRLRNLLAQAREVVAAVAESGNPDSILLEEIDATLGRKA